MIAVDKSNNRITAISLGYSGLIPFIVFALAGWSSQPYASFATNLLITYAAIILGFMGAVHWGAALVNRDRANPFHYIASVIPPLHAWMALMMPVEYGLITLAIGFVLLYGYERTVNDALGFNDWYLPMRRRLTMIVSSCLLISLMAQLWQLS